MNWGTVPEWIQAIAAVGGLIGLAYYVRYTKRMTRAAEDTRRVVSIPMLVGLEIVEPGCYDIDNHIRQFRIQNLGQGPAIRVMAWHESVPENYDAKTRLIPWKWEKGANAVAHLMSGESMEVKFSCGPRTAQRLMVIQYLDVNGRTYQMQWLQRGDGSRKITQARCESEGIEPIDDTFAGSFERGMEQLKRINRSMESWDQ